MNTIDKIFDINMVLMTMYVSLEPIREKKKIELVYDIDPTIPKELKGDVNAVTHILTHTLTYVLHNCQKNEVVLSLHAPKDFLYEESISFVIEDTTLSQEEIREFFELKIKTNLDAVGAEIIYSENTSDIHINIPFKLNELGNRRYYRLPDIGMLGKKVLVLSKSKKIALSLEKMFHYFLYEVDVGKEAYKKRGSNLAYYDILIVENTLVNAGLEDLVEKVQKMTDLKYVVLSDSLENSMRQSRIKPTCLPKPAMQESIYELIIALYEKEVSSRKIKIIDESKMINMNKYIDEAFVKSEKYFVKSEIRKLEQKSVQTVEVKKEQGSKILDPDKGMHNTKNMGLVYRDELKTFINTFERSDIYFRELCQSKVTWQIKEFCMNLEKQSRLIAAQRVADIAEQISLLFVYDKLGDLPMYAAKYHLELDHLIPEIKNYLKE